MPAFVLLVRPRGDEDPAIGIGFTVTKKIGGAVIRNRIKRRFRALAREVLPEAGLGGSDYVMIGRSAALTRDYAQLAEDLRKALRKTSKPSPPCSGEGRSAGSKTERSDRQGSGLRQNTGADS